ncbi:MULTISPECIES: hypothetical protein [Candidatus Ichthyocystis]|uniref:Uncharacterized protein n=1 Tax=Candidatus Ichthyocystis hellenicum TaxID=1561003 RepID=A0A0S4M1P1_9BURK|nr:MULTISPECIES: hypothetical protein [Ichthyocystis]CUT17703.1 hypothetical protein Ark11_0880 [Candidatus Ichthyocystis hellenicum]
MDNIRIHGFQDCTSQIASNEYFGQSYKDSDSTRSSDQCVSAHNIFEAGCDHKFTFDADGSCSSSYRLIKYLCLNYGFSVSFEAVEEVFKNCFFQLHAAKFGYQFTENFLSVMNAHRDSFVSVVDSILTDLYDSFSFLRQLGDSNITLIELMDKVCFSFSESSYNLRGRCCDILQSKFIPLIINSIFDASVIDGGLERKMTYCEMEKFFIHYITTLERIVMSRIMDYWNNFCDENTSMFSPFSGVSYRDPFYYAHHVYGVSKPVVTCPAAFSNKFGAFISFMAVAKIDCMINNFIKERLGVIKSTIRSKCTSVHDKIVDGYNADLVGEIKKIRECFPSYISGKFSKMVNFGSIRDKLHNFLKKLLIWDSHDVGIEAMEESRLSLLETITNQAHELLKTYANDIVYAVTRDFHSRIIKSRKIVSRVRRSVRTVKDKWGVCLHPRCSHGILSIRRKFSAALKEIVKSKFCSMINDGYKVSGISSISKFTWNEVSKDMFPIIQEEIRPVVFKEREELSVLLSKARIVVDNDKFDGSYSGTREATSEEIVNVLRIAVYNMNVQTKSLIRAVWSNVTKVSREVDSSAGSVMSSKQEEFVNVESYSESSLSGKDVDLSAQYGSSAVSSKLVYASLVIKGDRIFNRWGLNVHPDDVDVILFIRTKFSKKIKDLVRIFFSSIPNEKSKLKRNNVFDDYKWSDISGELYPIVLEHIDPIIKEEYSELEEFLSKARVVVVGRGDTSSCVIRSVTNDEKDNLMKRAVAIIHKELRSSVRSVWAAMNKISKFNFGGDFKDGEVEKSIYCGIRLRYEDSMDIVNIKRRFLFDIKGCIVNIFSELTKTNKFPWRYVSKDVIPTIKKEFYPIMEKEREELDLVLLKSRAVVGDSEYDKLPEAAKYREITYGERSEIVEFIMACVYKKAIDVAGRVWRGMIKFHDVKCVGPIMDNMEFTSAAKGRKFSDVSFRLSDISRVDKDAIDNIRLEFIGSLGPIIDEVINKVLLEVGGSLSSIESMVDKVIPVVAEKSSLLFNNSGFCDSLNSLLSSALVVGKSRRSIFLSDKERDCAYQMFMDSVNNDRDNLIKKRVIKLTKYSKIRY